jgi:hypothetical protein
MTAWHPTPFELERLHAGEFAQCPANHVAGHVATCTPCQRILSELHAERQAMLAHWPAQAFVRNLRAHVNTTRTEKTRHAAWMTTALSAATAAALFLSVLGRIDAPTSTASLGGPRRKAMASHELQAKGSSQLAVIRKRGGEQQLSTERLEIGPGDELRVRFHVDRKQHIAAGILADDGTWVPFFEAEFDTGIHIPRQTLRVDAQRTSGRVLLGPREAVLAARNGSPGAGLQAVQLIWGAGP